LSSLIIHRSTRTEVLADLLAQQLAAHPPADPLAPARVVVGSLAMERWLRNRLATARGICANIDFPLPGRALATLVDESTGGAGAADPWSPELIAWALAAELPELVQEPGFAPARRYLEARGRPPRPGLALDRHAYAWCRQVGDLFDRYSLFRPDWVAAWLRGRQPPSLPDSPHLGWQALCWQRLARRLDPSGALALRAASLQPVATKQDPVHVFGLSALPPLYLDLLGRLAAQRRVHLYAFVPSLHFLGDLRLRSQLRGLRGRLRGAGRQEILAAIQDDLDRQNPLLSSFGRLSRDFQLALEDVHGGYQEPIPFLSRVEHPHTLLGWLQRDIGDLERQDTAGPADLSTRQLSPHDQSLRVHACHGPTRQVELLREALLGLLADHPQLQPRDILVMTPDIATYAPLVLAEFHQGRSWPRPASHGAQAGWGPTGAPRLPVAISDLGLRALNPVADALLRLLELADGRVTASAVLDLLALDPVQRRFGLSAPDLDELRGWLQASGFRWGLHAADRAAHDQPRDLQNTLRFGLERLALGVVSPDEGPPWQGVLPVDLVEGAGAARLGRLLAFARCLENSLGALARPRSVPDWHSTLTSLMDGFTQPASSAGWLTEQVVEQLDALHDDALQADFQQPLQLGTLRQLLSGRFDLPCSGDRPITGAVTLSAMSPMRSVPYPVICLLGLDDGAFPRRSAGAGFDLLRSAPRVGDRDPRDEDLHLFLEALLSARSHLQIFFTGRDPHSNEPLPPATPVASLLDAADGCCQHSQGRPPRQQVLVQHALQPFSTGSFQARHPGRAADQAPRPWSFHRGMRSMAGQLRQERQGSTALFRDGPLPAASATQLQLQELVGFLRKPVRSLLQRRLGLHLARFERAVQDREPVELGGLERWGLGHDLLQQAVVDPQGQAQALARARAAGQLPLGSAGVRAFDLAWARAQAVLANAGDLLALPRHDARVQGLQLDGLELAGRVQGLGDDGTVLLLCPDNPDKPRHLLRAWVQLLALACAGHHARRAWLVGPEDITALACPEQPQAALGALVQLYLQGQAQPLRLCERSSHAFAVVLAGEPPPWGALDPGELRRALSRARACWEPPRQPGGRPGESEDPHLAAVFADAPPFQPNTASDPVHPEFLTCAQSLWQPLLQAQTAGGSP